MLSERKRIYMAGAGGMLGEGFRDALDDRHELRCTDKDVNANWLSFLDFRDFDAYRDKQTSRLVGLSRWESEQAFLDALPLIGSLAHERREEWSEHADEVLMLSPG